MARHGGRRAPLYDLRITPRGSTRGYAGKITAAARPAFLSRLGRPGRDRRVILGAILVFFFFPGKHRERELLSAGYQAEDACRAAGLCREDGKQKLGQLMLPMAIRA